jgi:hypothetical protein
VNSIAATLGKSVVRATTSCGSCIRKAPNLRQLIFELPPATKIPPELSNGERSRCRNVTLQNSSPRSTLEKRCRPYAMQKRRIFLGKYKHQADPFHSYGRCRPPLLPAPRSSLDRFKLRFLRHRRMPSHMPTRSNPFPSTQGGLHLTHPFRVVLDILQSSARKSAFTESGIMTALYRCIGGIGSFGRNANKCSHCPQRSPLRIRQYTPH